MTLLGAVCFFLLGTLGGACTLAWWFLGQVRDSRGGVDLLKGMFTANPKVCRTLVAEMGKHLKEQSNDPACPCCGAVTISVGGFVLRQGGEP